MILGVVLMFVCVVILVSSSHDQDAQQVAFAVCRAFPYLRSPHNSSVFSSFSLSYKPQASSAEVTLDQTVTRASRLKSWRGSEARGSLCSLCIGEILMSYVTDFARTPKQTISTHFLSPCSDEITKLMLLLLLLVSLQSSRRKMQTGVLVMLKHLMSCRVCLICLPAKPKVSHPRYLDNDT